MHVDCACAWSIINAAGRAPPAGCSRRISGMRSGMPGKITSCVPVEPQHADVLRLQALARFTQLQSISISCVGLTSFQGLPTSVQRLVAADNSISSGAVAGVTVAKGLTSLDLAGNRIRTVDALSCLKELKLKALDLSGNPVCETDNYREAVFKMLDELEYLDGKDRLGNGARQGHIVVSC